MKNYTNNIEERPDKARINRLSSSQKAAFTLAEVLITLGIIGVVAALTLPMLVQNYFKQMTETRLAKFYSNMNNAINLSTIENGDPDIWEWALLKRDKDGNAIDQTSTSEALFDKYLGKYIKVIEKRKLFDALYNRDMLIYYLSDGSAFGYPPHTNVDIHFFPYKAEKCLERTEGSVGSCRFSFIFKPIRGNDNDEYIYKKRMSPYLYCWDGTEAGLLHNTCGYGCSVEEGGGFCTAMFAFNGWKIPKDYPRKIKY